MIKNKDFKILSEIHGISLEEAKIIEFLPGVSIGPKFQELRRYEIISLLGIGSSGCVYLVKDYEENQNLYALKIILPHILNSQEQISVFIEVINDLYDFDHPNVLSVIDLWQQKKLYFYVTEYIEGTNLEEWVNDIKLKGRYVSIIDVCDIAVQICDAVKYLHDYSYHGLLHGNNILLKDVNGKKKVRITDFGIQSLFSSNTKKLLRKSEYGRYLAPEFLDDSIDYKLTDIYSLGVLLYRMLTYEYPSNEESRVSTVRYDISPTIDDIVLRAMNKNPDKRYNSIEELKDDLKMFQKDISSRKGRTLRFKEMPDVSTKRRKVQEATGILSGLADKYKQKDTDIPSTEKLQTSGDTPKNTENNAFQFYKTDKSNKKKDDKYSIVAKVEQEYNTLAKQIKPESEIENSLKEEFSLNLKYRNQTLSDIGPLDAIPIERSDSGDEISDEMIRTETTRLEREQILHDLHQKSQKNENDDEENKPRVIMKRYFPSSEEEEKTFDESDQEKTSSEFKKEVSSESTQEKTSDESEQEESSDEFEEKRVVKTKMKRYFPTSLNLEEEAKIDSVVSDKIINSTTSLSPNISELKQEIESRSLFEDVTSLPSQSKNKLKRYFPSASNEASLDKKEEEPIDSSLKNNILNKESHGKDEEKLSNATNTSEQEVESSQEEKLSDTSEQEVESSQEEKLSDTSEQKVESSQEEKLSDASEQEVESSQEEKLSDTSEQEVESSQEEKLSDTSEQEVESSQEEKLSDTSEQEDKNESHIICPQEINEKQLEMQKILEEGDALANDELFEEAIMKWQQVVDFIDPIEIEDRIMQIVDMSAEMAQEKLDEDNCRQAQKILEVVMPYTTDDFVENLYDEVLVKVQEQEKDFQNALEQVNNHLQKKQYQAAIQVLTSIRDISPEDSLIDSKIQEISKIQGQVDADEAEYMQLMFTAKVLEEKSNYYEALQTFEKIRQKQSRWLCPISDISSDIERVSKLVASTEVSERANKLLTQVEKLVTEKQWREAKEVLANPVFSRKLVPKVEKRLKEKQEKVKNLEKEYSAKMRNRYATIGVVVIVAISVTCYYLFAS